HIFTDTATSSNALVTGGGRDHYERAEAVVPVGDQSAVVAAPLAAQKSHPAAAGPFVYCDARVNSKRTARALSQSILRLSNRNKSL
uniref:Uncharacterized protein n=1 Tax=Plectus sambesii TaxID=2011161 RepID=A0A914UV23_9BILA